MEIFWKILTEFGNLIFWIILCFSTVYIYPFLPKKMKKIGWVFKFLILSILISYFITGILKNIFKLPRPCVGESFCPEGYSFPSGHSTAIFSAITAIFLKSKNKKFLPLFLLALLVAYSRVALRYHTFYDIIAGSLLGIFISFSTFKIYERFLAKVKIDKFCMRKIFHLSFILILYFIDFLPIKFLQIFFLILSTTFFIFEILRLKGIFLSIYEKFISTFTLPNEKKGFLIEPFSFFLSITILLFFPFEYFLIGVIPLVIGDAFSGLVGKKIGKIKIFYNKKKKVEGSFSFFLSTLISFLYFFDYKISLILSLFSTFAESLLSRYENLILPFSTIIFYSILTYLLLI